MAVEYYRELARLISQGKKVAILGAKSDEWVWKYFSDLNVGNLIGKYTLLESLALLKGAKSVVTHDSGPMHMAGTMRVPVLSIFRPTRPDEKRPTGIRSQYVWGGEDLDCRPCYDGREYADCHHHRCLRDLRPGEINLKLMEMLK